MAIKHTKCLANSLCVDGPPCRGFNWSNFTGLAHNVPPEKMLLTTYPGRAWYHDPRDVRFFSETVGVHAIFRGHEDDVCAFKLVVKDRADTLPWEALLAHEHTPESLRSSGLPLARFLGPDAPSVPVFTFSSCTEAKSLRDEGYGVVTVGATLAEWNLKPCIYRAPSPPDGARSWMLSVCAPCDEPGAMPNFTASAV